MEPGSVASEPSLLVTSSTEMMLNDFDNSAKASFTQLNIPGLKQTSQKVSNLVQQTSQQVSIQAQQTSQQVSNLVQPISTPTLDNPVRLQIDALPFVPLPKLIPVEDSGRSTADIIRDHAEVERVLLGGTGTATQSSISWLTEQPEVSVSSNQVTSLSAALPFSNVEIPSSHAVLAKPVARTGHLKEVRVMLHKGHFIDRQLPQPTHPLSSQQRFTPTYYVALHNLVAGGGHDGNGFWYPPNTPNYKGARIPLAHTGLNIKNWRRLFHGYLDGLELIQFMEYGFPLGLVEAPVLSPCTRNHGSSYQYYPHIDKFVSGEIRRNGLTGPFNTPPWQDMMISPMMTAPKKPDSRRPVFDATFGDFSLNNCTPNDCYLGTPTVYSYLKIDDF